MESKLKSLSNAFWDAMLKRDGDAMYALADPGCTFVHIGANADLEKEVYYYTSGAFNPTNIDIHSQQVNVFNNTAIVLTDVDYGLLLNGSETTHHFMVTEVWQNQKEEWKLIQFSFTALVY